MPYKITITKTTERKTTMRGDYAVIDERPWTAKELSEERDNFQSTESFLERTPLRKVYGYQPDYEATETVETEVLKQTVDDLDLPAVIKAVNRI